MDIQRLALQIKARILALVAILSLNFRSYLVYKGPAIGSHL